MATACIAQTTLQVHGIPKPIIARFDQPHASSDGGALLLKAVDERLGLTWRLASTIRDRRQPGKVAPDACSAGRACGRGPLATQRRCMARPAMPLGAGTASDASS
jgi:hypothetical protein